ncbi:phosphotransferase [Kitasatospora purpeofusca]|uniref:phosphotransferase n=1 Tax=Kitasatospora purpeofusca TaxID=67352 RepID=UPI00225BC60B|nr:phosphotransferase [Kitasatospora purpeofusca]MCX4758675.1 phosphotransferase [Kitasatospora purpeofusca]WSR30891.1 phosphotransferase [Kitasatospora purpeofusca]
MSPAERQARALDPAGQAALAEAAGMIGLDPTGAVVLQHRKHTVVRLPRATGRASAVAKIYKSGEDRCAVQRQTTAAHWLRDNGVMTARPLSEPAVTRQGRLVTFSEDLGDGGPVSCTQLAHLLLALHALPVPEHLCLPVTDPARQLLARIAALPRRVLAPADRHWLHGQVTAAGHQWSTHPWPQAPVVVHGDLNTFNTLLSPGYGPALLDLESLATGPALYDLAFIAWTRDGFAADPREYEDFRTAYGVDVTTVQHGAAYRVLARLRAACGVVIALEAASRDPAWLPEATHRTACLRRQGEGPATYPWDWNSRERAVLRPGRRAAADPAVDGPGGCAPAPDGPPSSTPGGPPASACGRRP